MAYTTINDPTDYFNTVLYTGTGATQSITGVGFQPDLVWGKMRDISNRNNWLHDAVRSATKGLHSDETNAEYTDATVMNAFNSDGFTVVSHPISNASGGSYVSWNWLASNSTASNTDGSITSTVSANTTSGFSIVSYSGSASNITVGHGLGVTPQMILIKNRTSAADWTVYHKSLGNAKLVRLNTTSAEESTNQFSFGTSPTSSVFALGGGYSMVNTSGANYIAYCFAEKKGFSKFGSYTGNGNADGTFVYTGFSPSFVMVKKTNGTGNWVMFDNKRNTFNVVNKRLVANLSDDEGTSDRLDFLSNGWKFRSTATNVNGSDSYIYMAFAESPFTTSTGVPTTAR